MILWRMWATLLAFLLAGIVVALMSPARSHGSLSWAAEYLSASNVPCCTGPSALGPGDCTEVPEAVAMLVRLGGTVMVQFPSGERPVRINRIYSSPDPHAPYVVCAPGCAFSREGA